MRLKLNIFIMYEYYFDGILTKKILMTERVMVVYKKIFSVMYMLSQFLSSIIIFIIIVILKCT